MHIWLSLGQCIDHTWNVTYSCLKSSTIGGVLWLMCWIISKSCFLSVSSAIIGLSAIVLYYHFTILCPSTIYNYNNRSRNFHFLFFQVGLRGSTTVQLLHHSCTVLCKEKIFVYNIKLGYIVLYSMLNLLMLLTLVIVDLTLHLYTWHSIGLGINVVNLYFPTSHKHLLFSSITMLHLKVPWHDNFTLWGF